MRALAGLRQLECLTFQNSGLAGAGAAVLPTLTGLRRLELAGAPRLTTHGLEGVWLLKGLRSLKLDLSGEFLEDSADRVLTHIKSLTKLEELSLQGRVTDEGLRSLANVRSLRRIDLGSCNGYTDAGFEIADGGDTRHRGVDVQNRAEAEGKDSDFRMRKAQDLTSQRSAPLCHATWSGSRQV